MLFSMTGFGRCLVENPVCRQQWEIRSVNGKYLDLKWKLPGIVKSFEYQLEKVAKQHAVRGRVEISLDLRMGRQYAPKPSFDSLTASAMMDALKDFGANQGLQDISDCSLFFLVSDLWSDPEIQAADLVYRHIEEGLVMALEDWNQSRQSEGMALGEDLLARVRRLENWHSELVAKIPEIKEIRLEAFKRRMAELLAGESFDPARINQEIVIIGDKMDVTEELTRLSVHLSRLVELLESDDPDIGRRLDFTLQECFREINTCGNKMPDAGVSGIIVNFKNELEKCREQAMNLE